MRKLRKATMKHKKILTNSINQNNIEASLKNALCVYHMHVLQHLTSPHFLNREIQVNKEKSDLLLLLVFLYG